MAVCTYCDQEMTTARSCSVAAFHRNGVAFNLVRYGAETRDGPPVQETHRCHDCGVEPGGLHHIGCDWAQCPACAGQMMSCGCRFDEDGDADDEDTNWWDT